MNWTLKRKTLKSAKTVLEDNDWKTTQEELGKPLRVAQVTKFMKN